MTIAVVDYGAGNLTSVKKALDALGTMAIVTSDVEQISRADKLIVPGVGHFGATAALERNGMLAAIKAAIQRETPLLGICLGMQWLCTASTEAPELAGLKMFDADCSHFPSQVKAPHVGWNDLTLVSQSRIMSGIPQNPFVYFTHSFRVPVIDRTVATCEYGGVFSAVIEQGRIFGVQFHPEKSGAVGRKILENFCELPC